jgi:hypothetical protein
MNLKRVLALLGFFCLIAISCADIGNKRVEVEGEIKNLGTSPIYVSYYKETEVLAFDTIYSSKSGKFHFKIQSTNQINPVTLYFKNKKCWTTLFAKPGDHISMHGDIQWVDLLDIRGGAVNNDLSCFKKRIRNLYIERLHLLTGDYATEQGAQQRIAEINLLLKNAAKEFIREKPQSIASVVLIQDFFYQEYDPLTRDLLGILEADASNCSLANKIREGILKW